MKYFRGVKRIDKISISSIICHGAKKKKKKENGANCFTGKTSQTLFQNRKLKQKATILGEAWQLSSVLPVLGRATMSLIVQKKIISFIAMKATDRRKKMLRNKDHSNQDTMLLKVAFLTYRWVGVRNPEKLISQENHMTISENI